MISVVMCVKDRENERIQRCVDSLKKLDAIKEIIVVDYGSKENINVFDCKVTRYEENKIFNKSHALNLGIRQTKQPFVMCVDCDIIFPFESLVSIQNALRTDRFIVNTNVRRIKISDIPNWGKSWEWNESIGVGGRLNSKANGGIQIFSKKWIEKVRGYDENLILLGGPDNDLYNRALRDNLQILDINYPIYHQEHDKRKEEILPEKDREKGGYIRLLKSKYIHDMFVAGKINRNEDFWGIHPPNQGKFISWWENYEQNLKSDYLKKEKFKEELVEFVKNKKDFPPVDIDLRWQR